MTADSPPPNRFRAMVVMVILLGSMAGAVAYAITRETTQSALVAPAPATTTTRLTTTTTPAPTSTASTTTSTTVPAREPGTVPGFTVGEPWGSTVGLTMFRGNPTRTFYGTGPLPENPSVVWSYPGEGTMCGSSSVAGVSSLWCGSGWTGQPVVWERPDRVTEVIFGAYDRAVHFLDAETGQDLRPPFVTGDIIKGSVTLDPDGYPLLYFGSRDNRLRIIALDRAEPVELWALEASAVDGIWNDDWDGNPVIVDDVMYEGGENSWFFAIKLNRSLGSDGLVAVEPEILFQVPGWTEELLDSVGSNVSIESSVMVHGETAYFANSGGRVAGLDISEIESGAAPVVFDYWVGDDTDATLISDRDGHIYVAVEEERRNQRSRDLGQLIKLDPLAEDPFVWGVQVPGDNDFGGFWATPALGDGVIYASSNPGDLLVVDQDTGEVVFREEIGWHSWSSPVVVGEELLVASCTGELRSYSIVDPRHPVLQWSFQLSESCIESTPAVWNGRIYVGVRDGKFYAVDG